MKLFELYKRILPLLFFCVCLYTAITIQTKYDSIVHPEVLWGKVTTKFVLPSSFVSNFSFGFRNILADFYWITIIQDLPEWNGKAPFLIEEYTNLVTLDPKFEYPYLFGILTVSNKQRKGSTELIEPLAKLGIRNLPYNWEIPYYLGVQFNLIKNYEKALAYITIAASRPIVPDLIHSVYTSFSKKTLQGDDATRAFIQSIYDTTESKTTKKIIEEGMVVSTITKQITDTVLVYKKIYGKYPTSLQDLVDQKLLTVSPALEKEFTVTINKATGVVEILPKN